MFDQLLNGAILVVAILVIVVLALMFVKRDAVLPFLRRIRRSRKPEGRKMAERFAKQVLSGAVTEELQKYCTPGDDSDRKCRNCGGGNPTPLWRLSALNKYLELGRLTDAIWKAELCDECILAMAKIARAYKAVLKPAPADKGKGGVLSGWWSQRKKRITFVGKGLIGTGALIGFTSLFTRFFPQPGLSELKLYLYVLIGLASLIWINRWLVEKNKK